MKRPMAVAAALAVLASCGEVEAPTTGSGGGGVVAFVDVNVVPMDEERILEHQTVLVEGGRIAALGRVEEIEVPEEAERIEASGAYLLPGLAEMHGHLPGADAPPELAENVLFLYVANGVTIVRGMQGNPSQLELRERVDRGELVGPRLVVGSPSMNGGNVQSVEDAVRLVREYEEAGFDLLKVHEGLTEEVYAAIAETARELGIPFGGHVSDHVGLFRALSAGQTTIDHLDNYVQALVPDARRPAEPPGLFGVDGLLDLVDRSRMDLVVQATIDADAAVVPTMVLWQSGIFPLFSSDELLAERTETRYLPQETVARWVEAVDEAREVTEPDALRPLAELRRVILIALHEGGARILLGTDSPQIFSVPGFSIHREMQLYVDAGMSPFDVLASGSREVGRYFEEDFGTVRPGARADLLLVDGNPLEDIASVARRRGVMVRGRFLSESEIQSRLERIAASHES